uniref:Uncharacterized protein n=1 Tax=Clastoptera arizonana TaxID=38151 RepID=A0A1B6CZX4_9HEMI
MGYPNQQPEESDEEYVRRLYSRKVDESDEKYILRIAARYTSETDETYKERIALVAKIFSDVKILERLSWSEERKMYVYMRSAKDAKGFPQQRDDEPDEMYAHRVYTKLSSENDEQYIVRVASRYKSETDDSYKARVELIAKVFSQFNIMQHLVYKEEKKMYVYVKTVKAELYHCQQPGEADDVYVRRVYTRGSNESERDYYLRITSRSSTETDQKYKERIELIQNVLQDLPLKDKIIYDDHAKLYIYVQSAKEARESGSLKGYPGQQNNEPNDAYAKRVYARQAGESEMDYYLRFTSRYSSETDESYKARIDLIVKTFKDQNLMANMSYDEDSGLYVYMQPLKK